MTQASCLTSRLSNAEYDHTIRDLTGQDMQVARVSVDPANQAGFGVPANPSPCRRPC